MYVVDIAAHADAVGRAHGELFGDVRPAATMIEVAALIDPRMLVEIEVDARPAPGAADDRRRAGDPVPRRRRRAGRQGRQLLDLRDAGDPVELARRYDAEGADELVFLDITASSGDRATTYDVVRRTAEQVFIPLTVGGGVRTRRRRRPAAAGRRRQGRRQHRGHRPARAGRPRSPTGSARRCWCSASTRGVRWRASRPPSPASR